MVAIRRRSSVVVAVSMIAMMASFTIMAANGFSTQSRTASASAASSGLLPLQLMSSQLSRGRQGRHSGSPAAAAASTELEQEEWLDLSQDGGVQKKLIQKCSSDDSNDNNKPYYPEGTVVSYSYRGTVAASDWSAEEVIRCWLCQQQGLDHLADSFRKLGITEDRLIDPDYFTEDLVRDELGVAAKLPAKKMILAAKRLATSRAEFPPGTEFDASDRYETTLGSGKVIRGMELGIANMMPGEIAEIRIRSDYAYGGEGVRKRNGEVLVPPFATLLFRVELN